MIKPLYTKSPQIRRPHISELPKIRTFFDCPKYLIYSKNDSATATEHWEQATAPAAAAAAVAAATDYNTTNAWPDLSFGWGQTTAIQAYQIDQLLA